MEKKHIFSLSIPPFFHSRHVLLQTARLHAVDSDSNLKHK